MRPYIIYMEKRDPNSNERYHCIVFHCDFSAGCMKGDTQKNRTVSTSASVLSKHQYSCSSCTTAWYGTRIHRQVSAIHSLTQQMRMKRDQNSIQIDSHTHTRHTLFSYRKKEEERTKYNLPLEFANTNEYDEMKKTHFQIHPCAWFVK